MWSSVCESFSRSLCYVLIWVISSSRRSSSISALEIVIFSWDSIISRTSMNFLSTVRRISVKIRSFSSRAVLAECCLSIKKTLKKVIIIFEISWGIIKTSLLWSDGTCVHLICTGYTRLGWQRHTHFYWFRSLFEVLPLFHSPVNPLLRFVKSIAKLFLERENKKNTFRMTNSG